jgi:Flp pilus assembly protein protease CpaA
MDMLLLTEINMPYELARIAVALAGCIAVSYFDIFNNKNIPEKLLYAFLTIALLVNLVAFDTTATFYGLASAFIISSAFFLLYKIGYVGGADVFVLAALAMLLPAQPQSFLLIKQPMVLMIPYILNLVLASGLPFVLYMLFKSIPVAIKALSKKGSIPKTSFIGAGLLVVMFGIFSYLVSTIGFIPTNTYIFLSALVAFMLYFTLFKQAINDSMIEEVHHKDVEQEDILAVDKMTDTLKHKLGIHDKRSMVKSNNMLVTADVFKKLSHYRGKIPVYKGLPPYLPFITIGLILTLLFGNIVLFVTGNGL